MKDIMLILSNDTNNNKQIKQTSKKQILLYIIHIIQAYYYTGLELQSEYATESDGAFWYPRVQAK